MKKIVIVFLALFLNGCSLFVTGDNLGREWPGEKIEILKEHWGAPHNVIINENGEQEVIYKIFSDTCTYTFLTDSMGVVTSYKYESTFWGTCKPIG